MKIKLTLTLLLIVFGLQAQKKEKQKAYNLIAEETCECVSNSEFTEETSLERRTKDLGLCMFRSYSKVKKKSKYLKNNPIKDFETFGEEVGEVMGTMCPEVVLSVFSTKEILDMVDEDEEENEKATEKVIETIFEGKLTSYHNDGVSYVKIQDEFKKEHVFIIIEKFEGVELLTAKNLNKNFKVNYEDYSIFDLSEKQYVAKKAIKSLELI